MITRSNQPSILIIAGDLALAIMASALMIVLVATVMQLDLIVANDFKQFLLLTIFVTLYVTLLSLPAYIFSLAAIAVWRFFGKPCDKRFYSCLALIILVLYLAVAFADSVTVLSNFKEPGFERLKLTLMMGVHAILSLLIFLRFNRNSTKRLSK